VVLLAGATPHSIVVETAQSEYVTTHPHSLRAIAPGAVGGSWPLPRHWLLFHAARLLLRWQRGLYHAHTHSHDDGPPHRHVHSHAHGDSHEHSHHTPPHTSFAAFGVGLVPGIGGSGGLTLLLLLTISDSVFTSMLVEARTRAEPSYCSCLGPIYSPHVGEGAFSEVCMQHPA
jgi:hypothetical protein